jgi:hypothetical protein
MYDVFYILWFVDLYWIRQNIIKSNQIKCFWSKVYTHSSEPFFIVVFVFYANLELIFINSCVKIVVSLHAYLHFAHLFCFGSSKLEVTILLMCMRFDVLSMVSVTVMLFWGVMSRRLIDRYQCFALLKLWIWSLHISVECWCHLPDYMASDTRRP